MSAIWMIQNHGNKLAADVFMHISMASKHKRIYEVRGNVLKIVPQKSLITGHDATEPFDAVIVDAYEDIAGLVSDLHTMMSHGLMDDDFLQVTKMAKSTKIWVVLLQKVKD